MKKNSQKTLPAYAKTSKQIATELQVDPDRGLSPTDAKLRLQKYGRNEISRFERKNFLKILGAQVINPMILLLLAVILISIGIGHATDASIIAVIVALNVTIGFTQEMKAEKAMASIRALSVPEAKVWRDGKLFKTAAAEVVPGDCLHFEAGDRIAADVRFIEANAVMVDESLLTGESVPVLKNTQVLESVNLIPGDQSNMGFTGTHLVAGRGIGICVATGMQTQLGRIAALVSTEKAGDAPLKQRTDQMTRHLVLIAFFFCLAIFAIGAFSRQPLIDVFLAAITLAIAAIPEGLPAVITISLSLGSLALSKRGVLVRKLQAVEALGSITTICTDKTGTLTLNRMEVKSIYFKDQESRDFNFKNSDSAPHDCFFPALVLCNDARLSTTDAKSTGDPMEIALLNFACDQGFNPDEVRLQFKRVHEIPFDANRKRMTTIHEHEEETIAFLKGAPETVLPLCEQEMQHGVPTEITPARREKIQQIQSQMASNGLRILAVAMKKLQNGSETHQDHIESKMIFLGLIGLQDPLRDEVKAAIQECRMAGIRPVMITGDHPITALAIGRELGMNDSEIDVMTSADLNQMNSDDVNDRLAKTSIFARVSPEDKLRIVKALKNKNQFVAMTGDGVNDAPALKTADVGIAMGRGTDVAKEASALILIDENFSTIVHAIKEGRVIYDNIRKFIRYMLTTNLGEIATMLLAMLFFLPIPLVPVQILWINLVTDGLPAIALGFEPAEKNVMSRPPRSRTESLLGQGLWQHTIWVGVLMGILGIGIMIFFMKQGYDLATLRTIVFTTLVLAQMAHVLAIRSETLSLWKIGLFSNYRLAVAVMLTILSQLLLIYLKPLQSIFHTVALTPFQLASCFIAGSLIFIAVEIEKMIRR